MGQDLERWAIEENIKRFKRQLEREERAERRAHLEKLLAAEEARLQGKRPD